MLVKDFFSNIPLSAVFIQQEKPFYFCYFAKSNLIISFMLIATVVTRSSLSGATTLSYPMDCAAFILCFTLATGRISPASDHSPIITVFSLNAMSVLAEYNAAARAESIALSASRTPPATLM